jgi:hypothetical protein
MESHKGNQGEDQIEELPSWSCRWTLLERSFLICKTDDQKADFVAELDVVQ